MEQREALYGLVRKAGVFNWDRMDGEEYALGEIHLISKVFQEEIQQATGALYSIYARVVQVLGESGDELLTELGLPMETFSVVRRTIPKLPLTGIGRFDFARTEHGLKMLEFNSDTPTGIVEAYYVNEKACRFFGYSNPNEGMESHLHQVFQDMVRGYHKFGYPTEHIYFSALEWHEEDAGTTRYLLEQSGLSGKFVPLKDLQIGKDRLYVLEEGQLQPVDVLYRLHALEILAGEKDVDGFPSGADLLDLVARGKVAFINPPSAFLAQSKGLQALIWSLHENRVFFTEEEHNLIETYMLPTFFDNPFIGHENYVKKPVFGREGGGVFFYEATGEAIEEDVEHSFENQQVVYQKAVDLEEIQVETLKGVYAGRLLWGSFIVGGIPSALVARVGGRITNNRSYYLPIGLKGDE